MCRPLCWSVSLTRSAKVGGAQNAQQMLSDFFIQTMWLKWRKKPSQRIPIWWMILRRMKQPRPMIKMPLQSAGMRNLLAQDSILCIGQSSNAFISYVSPVYDGCTSSTMRSAPVLSVKNTKLWKMNFAVRWLVYPQGDSVVPTTSDFLPVTMWICRDPVVSDHQGRGKKNVWMGGRECSKNRELLVQPFSANP